MANGVGQIAWSGSFVVTRSSQCAAGDLNGDKIQLPQAALEQLLTASTTSATSTSHTFTAFDPFNPYSVAEARQERLLHREHIQELPHPLMFRLSHKRNGKTVYAGVRDFSASKGQIALSPFLMEALGLREADVGQETTSAAEGIDMSGDDKDRAQKAAGELFITVKARQLPRGTYVRLRPLEAGYDPDDWRPLLERHFRSSFTTLTKDSVLSVPGVKGEQFRFLVDKVKPEGDGICVVDTDLEVDIEPLDEEQARQTWEKRAAKLKRAPGSETGSSIGESLDIWKEVKGQVMAGDYVDYELPSWPKSRALAIELRMADPDQEVDLYVTPKTNHQQALPRDSEHIFSDLSSPKDGVKRVVLKPNNAALENAESIMISVHGFSLAGGGSADANPRQFTLRAKAADARGSTSDTPTDLPESPAKQTGEEQCKNCLQLVASRTILLHENFCLRNNILCPQCPSVFQRDSEEWSNHWHCPAHPEASGSSPLSKAKHEYIQHTPHTCPSCGPASPFTFPSMPELARHRTTVCPHKIILCQFCHLQVSQEGDPLDPASQAETVISGLTAHERVDGACTTDCHLCGSIIRLRDMAAHMTNHELDKVSRPKPEVCRNALCGRTLLGIGPRGQVNGGRRMDQGHGNDLALCSLCYSPLYVSLHDPEGKALRRRIERRYLSQIMKGCGRTWCLNEWCKTGRARLGLEPLGSSAAAALPVVKPLLQAVTDRHSGQPTHFCADEASQKRGKLAETLAAEGMWEYEWCVAALEAEKTDVMRARGWLADWAPMRA